MEKNEQTNYIVQLHRNALTFISPFNVETIKKLNKCQF